MTTQDKPKFYSFTIPCKKYIEKYIEAVYGSPFEANNYSTVGSYVITCLEKKRYNANKLPAKGSSKHYTSKFKIAISLHNFRNIGSDISPENILAINRFFENLLLSIFIYGAR